MASTFASRSSFVPAPISLSSVPWGPHWPVNVLDLPPLVTSNGLLFLFSDPDVLDDLDVSLPSRFDAIPCSDVHDVPHSPDVKVEGKA